MMLEQQVRRATYGVIEQVIHLSTSSHSWMPVVTIEMNRDTLQGLIRSTMVGDMERRDGEWFYLDVKVKENPDVAPGLVRAVFHVEVTA